MAVSSKQRGAAGARQDANNSPKFGGTKFVDELSGGGESISIHFRQIFHQELRCYN